MGEAFKKGQPTVLPGESATCHLLALMSSQVPFPSSNLIQILQPVFTKPMARASPWASCRSPVLVPQSHWSQDGELPERSDLRCHPEGRGVNQGGDREAGSDRQRE